MNISTKIQGTNLKIYIDKIIHVYLDCNKLTGIQSWISSDGWYYIEFYGCDIKCAYDSKTLWEEILKQLDKLNLFVKHIED